MRGMVLAILSQSGEWSISPNIEVRMAVPSEIRGHKHICLTTFRKSGVAVPTPVWFSEANGQLYVKTRNDSGKYKRIRNNPRVQIAPCTMRGTITGPQFEATARILPPEDWSSADKTMRRKYWLTRLSFSWSKKNEYLEISIS